MSRSSLLICLALGALAANRARLRPLATYIRHMTVPTLYHGTSTKHVESILGEGLRRPCLTSGRGRALHYAEASAEQDGGEPVVIVVTELEATRLGPDTTSISEPVMVGVDMETLWDRADALVEKLGLDGWADLPWQASLRLCGSVRCGGVISPDQLSFEG